MQIVLCALNAKFIHSSYAVHSLMASARAYRANITVKEYTINHSEEFILSELFRLKPDVVAFSCYIWNIGMILNIAANIKKVLPRITIILGGPEVSYDYEPLLERHKINYIIVGEGEETFRQLVGFLVSGEFELFDIRGVAFQLNHTVFYTGDRSPIDLNTLPFVYEHGFGDFQNRIIYFETTRGCPFNCQYCLSSAEKGVRYLSLEKARRALDVFLSEKVRQVKFVDRTFNCDKAHAMGVWRYLIDNDNGVTNFHFEIAADLMDDDMIGLLKNARIGQFQFEIGVQSTNIETLSAIQRKIKPAAVFENVQKIKALGNIHLHLDLIAGLPGEGYESFEHSFNDVYVCAPEQLQLGFLKILKGSGLQKDAKKFGIVYREKAPYEVLFTRDIAFEEMLKLKGLEEMLALFYNSNKFYYSLRYIAPFFESAFGFYRALSEAWRAQGYHLRPQNKMALYTFLYEFCRGRLHAAIDPIRDLLRFDLYLCDNIKTPPVCLAQDSTDARSRFYNDPGTVYAVLPAYQAYTVRQIARMCAVERFDYDISAWIAGGCRQLEKKECALLFDYQQALGVPGVASFHAGFIDITGRGRENS